MISSAEQSGHARTKKRNAVTIGQVMSRDSESKEGFAAAVLKEMREHPELGFFKKWRLQTDDLETSRIISRMLKFWPRLSAGDKDLYLRAAESIAEAERVKKSWNPKANRDRYNRLAKNAVAAAKLVSELSDAFATPWAGESAPIGELIERLASFVEGTVDVMSPIDRNVTARTANRQVRTVKQRLAMKARRVNWALVRDLAWLASGKKFEPSESTVRRYLEEVRVTYGPAHKLIERNWELLRTASRFASQDNRHVFAGHAQVYLQDI